MIIEQIENGRYFEDVETQNYQHTHYRCHWHGQGVIECEAVCINGYGSCYGLGWGYVLTGQPNPNWDNDWTDFDVSELEEDYEARAENEWTYNGWVYE